MWRMRRRVLEPTRLRETGNMWYRWPWQMKAQQNSAWPRRLISEARSRLYTTERWSARRWSMKPSEADRRRSAEASRMKRRISWRLRFGSVRCRWNCRNCVPTWWEQSLEMRRLQQAFGQEPSDFFSCFSLWSRHTGSWDWQQALRWLLMWGWCWDFWTVLTWRLPFRVSQVSSSPSVWRWMRTSLFLRVSGRSWQRARPCALPWRSDFRKRCLRSSTAISPRWLRRWCWRLKAPEV